MPTHFVIFEINKHNKFHRFVTDFEEDFEMADSLCQSMNNFRENRPVYFCVRCLTQAEYNNIETYNPLINSVICIQHK